MSAITATALSKVFRQAMKEPGLKGSIKHLFSQKYTDKHAVNRIDLRIEEGETVAYLGPNGAGKSTTIKMLSGILVPTSGTVTVNGIIPHEQRLRHAKQIGVVFGQRTQLWWDIPVRESFALLKDIYEIPADQFKRNLDRFYDLLDLSDFADLPARKLSLGQRMRCDLAAALLHSPPIVFLDEPTIGLDIAVKYRIREFIKQNNQEQGTTIMLTTHDLDDIKDMCQRLIIIDKGQILYDGTIGEVIDRFAQERIMHFQISEFVPHLRDRFDNMSGIQVDHWDEEGRTFALKFNRFKFSAGEIATQIMSLVDVVDFRIDEPSIDEIIRKLYAGQLELQEESQMEAILA